MVIQTIALQALLDQLKQTSPDVDEPAVDGGGLTNQPAAFEPHRFDGGTLVVIWVPPVPIKRTHVGVENILSQVDVVAEYDTSRVPSVFVV